jgi:hypothetical protein
MATPPSPSPALALPGATRADGSEALAPGLHWLLSSAGDPVGLALLVVFGHDPATCDTAIGFAARLQRPVPEIAAALTGLVLAGVVETSSPSARNAAVSYWLSHDVPVWASLREFVRLYASGPAGRRRLIRALPAACQVAA